MYAIIETGGKQFRVRREGRVRVPTLRGEIGDRVTFDRVLYLDRAGGADAERGEVAVGSPLVEGARVVGEIVRHGRAPKIVVFKYKRRHRFRRKQGHRLGFTEVAITGFELGAEEAARRRGEGSEAVDVGTDQTAGKARQTGPYVCEECGRGFATERGLQQHRAKAHVE